MRATWEQAKAEAEANPGRTVTILFAPGEYPMPDPGTYVYKDVATPVVVRPPGIEVRFRVSPHSGRMTIAAGKTGRLP